MKKLICLLLVIILLSSCLIGCGQKDEETKLKEAFLFRFGRQGQTIDDVIFEYDGGDYNGARVVMLDTRRHEAKETTVTLAEGISIKYYDTNRLYVYKYGWLFSLPVALTLNIISKEDAQSIATNYNEEVTSFVDICDKYDFDSGEVDLGYYNLDDSHLKANAVMIRFDKQIIIGGKVWEKQVTIDYINSCLGADIASEIGFHIAEDAESITCKVFINNEDFEKLPEIMDELATVPGLLTVGCYSRMHYPEI